MKPTVLGVAREGRRGPHDCITTHAISFIIIDLNMNMRVYLQYHPSLYHLYIFTDFIVLFNLHFLVSLKIKHLLHILVITN